MGKNNIKNVKKVNKSKKRKDLAQVLEKVYTETVNLETKCCHAVCCCEVAMPSLFKSEYQNIIADVWKNYTKQQKAELVCNCMDYFFRYEYVKWGMETLIKPCLFLNKDTKMCNIYEKRPLNCRLYGLWPEKDYNERVNKFVKSYEEFGLKKEDIPLNTQCPNVKRVDNSVEITKELIDTLFAKLNNIDKVFFDYTGLQCENAENYKSFHDFLLFSVLGENWLVMMTNFILSATKEQMLDLLDKLKIEVKRVFSKNIPKVD